MYSDLDPIYNKFQRSMIGIGMAANVLLINLIIFRSPKDLGLYKYLMIYISCFELFYAVLEFLMVPDLLTLDSSFYVMVDPKKSFLPESCLQAADCKFFDINSSWTASTPLNSVFWLTTPLALASFYSYFVWAFMQRNEYTDKVLREVGYGSDQKIGFLGLIFYPKLANGTQIVNWDSFIGVSVTTGTLLASEFTMIYFAYKCFQATRIFIIRSCCSPKSRRLHWQFFYALVAQTIIPILFMQIPMTLIYTSTIVFRSSIPEIGHFQSLTIPIYLAIDALPTILIVRPYRDTVVRIICFWRKQKIAPRLTNSSNSKSVPPSMSNF